MSSNFSLKFNVSSTFLLFQNMLTHIRTRTREIDVMNLLSQIRNEDVVNFFTTKQFLNHCKRIAKGKCYKMRHQLVISGEFDYRFSNFMYLSNVCFLDDTGANSNIDQELKDEVYKIFHHLKISGASQVDSWFKYMYTNHVLIPEGIIYFLMETFNLNYKVANQIFLKTTTSDVNIISNHQANWF